MFSRIVLLLKFHTNHYFLSRRYREQRTPPPQWMRGGQDKLEGGKANGKSGMGTDPKTVSQAQVEPPWLCYGVKKKSRFLFALKVLTWSVSCCAPTHSFWIQFSLLQICVSVSTAPHFICKGTAATLLRSLLYQTQKLPPLCLSFDGVSAPPASPLWSSCHYQRIQISTLQPDTTWKRTRHNVTG